MTNYFTGKITDVQAAFQNSPIQTFIYSEYDLIVLIA